MTRGTRVCERGAGQVGRGQTRRERRDDVETANEARSGVREDQLGVSQYPHPPEARPRCGLCDCDEPCLELLCLLWSFMGAEVSN